MSPEEIGWLEPVSWGQSAEVSAEEVARVREDIQKSAQMRAQIQQVGQQQTQYAQLLILLLQRVSDDKLIGHIFHQLVEYKFPIPTLFAQFLPRIHDKVQMNVQEWPFAVLVPAAQQMDQSIEGVVKRFNMVNKQFAILVDYPQRVALVTDILSAYQLVDMTILSPEKRHELEELIKKEIR